MNSLSFIVVFITIINYAFCDKDTYYESLLTNNKNLYLVAENCEKVYVCGKHSKSGTF